MRPRDVLQQFVFFMQLHNQFYKVKLIAGIGRCSPINKIKAKPLFNLIILVMQSRIFFKFKDAPVFKNIG